MSASYAGSSEVRRARSPAPQVSPSSSGRPTTHERATSTTGRDVSVVASGGSVHTTQLVAFAGFGRAAVGAEKRFVVTHSEIFPGTFASTTETADWLLRSLGLRRTPVLRWGPRGMQQLSEVRAGRFELLGFAGNSGPDHIDHLQDRKSTRLNSS